MLIELYGQNFGCFRDEFRLSMLPTDIDPGSDRGIVEVTIEGDQKPLRLLRAAAIYGPNGSGKSTVLRAAGALQNLISEVRARRFRSDSPLRPYEPFALGANATAPVRIGVTGVVDKRVYTYEVQFERHRFVSERLLRLTSEGPNLFDGDYAVLFERKKQQVEGEWTKSDRFALLAKEFRKNALLLPLADRLAPSLARNIAVGIRHLLTRFHVIPEDYVPPWMSEQSATARRAHADPAFGHWLLGQLRSADIGVVDLHATKEEVISGPLDEPPEVENYYRLSLLHRGANGAYPIPYERESHGTRRIVEFAPTLYDLTHSGRPLARFVDEIDESLHPTLLQGMIHFFNCEVLPKDIRGQLIFVTHDTGLLDAEAKNAVLRRDQIYLTEKDVTGAARLYSVAEFKERNNLNLRRRYLQGRYGALPSLGPFPE